MDEAENLYAKYLEANINLHYKMKIPSLLSLLAPCRIHNDTIRDKRISDNILNLDGNIDHHILARMYVTLSNIYAQNNDFEKANEIYKIMKQKKNSKKSGNIMD